MAVRDSLPVTIGARKYNVDLAGLARSTIDPIRQGFDTQGTPGEQSLNQAGVWKRSRTSWDLGAGQREADTDEANNRRFYTSTGVDVWTRNEVTLLKTTEQEDVLDTTPDNFFMATAKPGTAVPDVTENHYIYCAYSGDVRYSNDDGETWAGLTNPAGGAIVGIASDGANVYVASAAGSGEVQRINAATVPTSTPNTDYWVIDDVDGLWVANGYLLVSVGPRLTQLAPGSAPSTDLDIAGASFAQVDTWKSVISTPAGIYAAGTKGNTSRIFYIGINDSTTNPLNPVIAAELPQGETVNVLAYYGGLLCIGTNKGIRLGMITGNGYVTYGPRIDIKDHDGSFNANSGTLCFEPQGEFIWFGWTDYTATTTGLGRLALSEFTSSLVPAYASDLMTTATVQGAVQGIVTSFDGRRLFSVADSGIWQEHATDYVTTGNVDSGRVRWGTTEKKAIVSGDLHHSELAASETVALTIISDDESTTQKVATSDVDGASGVGIFGVTTPVSGEYISAFVELTGPGGTTPILRRWTVRAIPMPFVSEVIKVPIMLSTYTDWDNRHVYHDTYDDYAYLKGLMEGRTLVDFKIGEEPTLTTYVAGVSYDEGSLTEWTDDRQWFEGILTVQLVTVQT